MATSCRVLIVTRHFWPTTNDDTLRLAQWTSLLTEHGHEVTVLTWRPSPDWPPRMQFGRVSVVRLETRPHRLLRSRGSGRQLAEWLVSHLHRFDCLFIDELLDDATGELERVDLCCSVVQRLGRPIDGRSSIADALFRRADSVLINNARWGKATRAAGARQVKLIEPSGIRLLRTIGERRLARSVLADLSHELTLLPTDKLLVCPGELTEEWQALEMLQALAPLLEQEQCLRLWMLGDGPLGNRLYRVARQHGVQHVVSFPGVFTELDLVLLSADLVLFPSPGEGFGWLVPTCARSGIPMLVADHGVSRDYLGEGWEQLGIEGDFAAGVRQRVEEWLIAPQRIARASMELERISTARYKSNEGADQILQIFCHRPAAEKAVQRSPVPEAK